jgi:outer membrane lipoprotein-sorting protein
LALLLSDDIDLTTNTHVTAVHRQPGYVLVSANAASGATQSQITVTFTDPGLELRQWEVLDSQGLKTTVVLNDMQSGVDLPADLFVIREAEASKKSQN